MRAITKCCCQSIGLVVFCSLLATRAAGSAPEPSNRDQHSGDSQKKKPEQDKQSGEKSAPKNDSKQANGDGASSDKAARDRDAQHVSDGKKGNDKYALIVGISNYHGSGGIGLVDLHGADDAVAMSQALQVRGFLASHICMLTDKEATRQGIETAFQHCLIDRAGPGVTLVFYFSGHGEQVTDDNGDEADGLDEALVPYDWARGSGQQNFLRDDRLGALLDAAHSKLQSDEGTQQGSIAVFLDSCYAGSATRGDGQNIIYRGPVHPRARPARRSSKQKLPPKGPTGFLAAGAGKADLVVMSAAQGDESALEQRQSPKGPWRGVFSYALTEVLKAQPGPPTYRALFEEIRYWITLRAPDQHPQMEGSPEATDHALFSQQVAKEGSYIPIENVDPVRRIVTLPVGTLVGASPGSRYALFPEGHVIGAVRACDRQAGCIGEVTLAQVGAVRSSGPLAAGINIDSLAAGRAVETLHCQSETPPIKVWIMPNTPVPAGLFSTDSTAVVILGSEQDHDVRIEVRDGAVWALRKDAPQIGRRRRANTGVLFRKILPALVSVRSSVASPTTLYGELLDALQSYWVHRHLTLLPRGSKNLDVGLRLTRSARQGSPAVAPDAVVFDLNEEASLELQNQSSNPVYVSLVELTRQGDIKLLYPDPRFQQENRSNRIPPHSGWIRIGASVLLSPPGQVLWKLLITQQQADFSGIAHQRVLKGGNAAATAAVEQLPASAQPLGRLLLYAVQRQRSQSLVAQPQDFATRDYWLHIGSAQRGRP